MLFIQFAGNYLVYTLVLKLQKEKANQSEIDFTSAVYISHSSDLMIKGAGLLQLFEAAYLTLGRAFW